MKNIFLLIVFSCIWMKSFSNILNKPIVTINLEYSENDSIISLKYSIYSKTKKIAIHKFPIYTYNCDVWFSEIVIFFEKYDSISHTYKKMKCIESGLPVLYPDGSLGPLQVLTNENSASTKVLEFAKKGISDGKFRIRLKHYYLYGKKKAFTFSNYVYLNSKT